MSPTAPNIWRRRSTRSAPAPSARCATATTSSFCRTAPPRPSACRFRLLLATSATHHHLIRSGLRTSVGLVVESGEPREVHQFCTLAGYGAEAINPYLAFETLEDMIASLDEKITREEVFKRYIKAVDKGILKVMSKMGISTYQSYCGAQIFDAVGLVERLRRRAISPAPPPRSKASACARSPRKPSSRPCDGLRRKSGLPRRLDVGGEYAVPHRAAKRMSGRRRRYRNCSMRCAAIRATSTATFARRERAERAAS